MPASESAVCPEPLAGQFLTDSRTDDFSADDRERATLAFCSADTTASFCWLSCDPVSGPSCGTRTITCRFRRCAVRLHDDVLAAAREVLVECGAHLLHRRLLLELRDDHPCRRQTPRPWGMPRGRERDYARDDDDPGGDDCVPSPAQEVVVLCP